MEQNNKRIGRHTVCLKKQPSIMGWYSTVGPKEGQGPLGNTFSEVIDDVLYEEQTWEKAESKLFKNSIDKLLINSKLSTDDIGYICGGDLLNQITSSCYAVSGFNIPFLGLFGACSTMAESLSVAGMLVDAGFSQYAIAATSSHFCSAEKQFRGPLELGSQRPPTSQWTVTGSGATLLAATAPQQFPKITHVTTGEILDYGINDAMNMGEAMAPAATATIAAHLKETGRPPAYYDLIITGDLGTLGSDIVRDLMKDEGYKLGENYTDCGAIIFDAQTQGTDCGGSGCACSASVLNGYILDRMMKKELNRVLFISTGALMSPLSIQQGQNILGIAHAVAIENIK